ncbi:hypothetical protein COW49_03810 [Candidatus Kaiserbacteria bacterium CG17_big_fil_post_rev_8_21_14_2_50_51_7]|uniref:Uncharacterized protein n=2 Tax=Candidatus Kaiseribacteriota TaxID=1752734 RepID=A0A2M7FC91_9BACT|nr:MAG: hypothetical protein COW49_03810 [Candidatus Kaiserbacteria bacterium CG17_big_fil_post_rev_8_21_14_2_50_51_7]
MRSHPLSNMNASRGFSLIEIIISIFFVGVTLLLL